MSAGLRSPGLRSATLPTAPSLVTICHRPARSGLPSAVRGAGAVRFGLPAAVRGMPGVRYCAHCAASGVIHAVKMIAVVKIFIVPNTSRSYYTPKDRRMPWRLNVGTALKGAPVTYAIGPKQYLAVQAGGRHLHPVKYDNLQDSGYLFIFALN